MCRRMGKYGLFVIVGAFLLFGKVGADRTHNKIYYNLAETSARACFRRFNGTHQIGCASSRGGNVGVLHYIEKLADLDWLLDHGPHKPYVPLMTSAMFTQENIQNLRKSNKVNGILVIHANISATAERPETFTPDKQCPNNRYNYYDQAVDESYAHCHNGSYNEGGNNLFFTDFEFPMMALLNVTEIDFLINDCYKKFNEPVNDVAQSYPLCAAHVKDAMNGAKDSHTCMRRSNMAVNLNPQSYCDPLGDKNVYSLLHAINSTASLENKSVIIAAARTDTFSLFDHLYPGADTVLSGMVTLLAAAEALGTVKTQLQHNNQTKPVMFALFAGEAFDYIGSGRMVYEMEQMHFPSKLQSGEEGPHPIGLQHIAGVVELNQVGIPEPDSPDSLWVHTDPFSMKEDHIKSQIKTLRDAMQKAAEDVGLDVHDTPEAQSLPSASLQSFLKAQSIPGIVITDHQDNYTNRYYNSRFDLPSTLGVEYPADLNRSQWYDHVTPGALHLQKVATTLARGLYQLSTGNNDTENIVVSNKTVTNLLYCFLIDAQCQLFTSVLKASTASSLANSLAKNTYDDTLPFYVGVHSSHTTQWSTALAESLFALYLGEEVSNSTLCQGRNTCDDIQDKCEDGMQKADKLHTYRWMQGPLNETSGLRQGRCVRSTANQTAAVSPVFDSHEFSIKNYDWKSTKYSTWTESSWDNNAMLLRVFLVPDRSKEIATLCLGVALVVLSLGGVYIINRRASTLFNLD